MRLKTTSNIRSSSFAIPRSGGQMGGVEGIPTRLPGPESSRLPILRHMHADGAPPGAEVAGVILSGPVKPAILPDIVWRHAGGRTVFRMASFTCHLYMSSGFVQPQVWPAAGGLKWSAVLLSYSDGVCEMSTVTPAATATLPLCRTQRQLQSTSCYVVHTKTPLCRFQSRENISRIVRCITFNVGQPYAIRFPSFPPD